METKKNHLLKYLILKIQNEEYMNNKCLPSVRFLSHKFGYSTNLVQEVYQELRNRNFIKSVKNVHIRLVFTIFST